jgi:DNA-binding LytR/AlgR family response regulator
MTQPTTSILIVEDEMIIAAKISMYLTDLGYGVAGILPRAEDVLSHLEDNRPDIILLDIQLKGTMTGIELAHLLRDDHRIPVVFLTANSDEATFQRAKEARPYAFLAKPFDRRELARALELTINLIDQQSNSASPEPTVLTDRIFVFAGESRVKVMLADILYLQAERNYCRIHTAGKEYLLSMPMKTLEGKLPQKDFQRIHRSFIVNLKQVDEVHDSSVRIKDQSLPMSATHRPAFLERIQSI